MPSDDRDDELSVPRGRLAAGLQGRMLSAMNRVAPGTLTRLAQRQQTVTIPPFPDLLRMVESMGELPDPTPESNPDVLLARHPELAAIEVHDIAIPGPHGPVPGRTYRPDGPVRTALVWIHGGAFIAGTLNSAEANWVSLELARLGIAVLSLDYRKALRGVHYPVPLDDVAAGWAWAVEHADTLGVAPTDLHVGGGSAGANLAAGLTKKLRDTPGATLPRTAVLAVPLLHSELLEVPPDELERQRAGANGAIFEPADLVHAAHNYAGRRSVLTDPYAFAAYGDLTGQPPLFILTSEYDPIRFSGEAYARAVTAAGGEVHLEMEPEAPHAALADLGTEAGRRSLARIVDWLLRDR